MLDVGCGAGRHSRYLALKGFQVTGIDLSFNNIREANKFKNDNLRFYRHDMRIPFGKEYFDYVFNFFTSFGYFKTHFENNSVIKNISAALKPGGKLVLDYLNTYYAKKQLILNEEKDIDGTVFHLTRWIDEKHFFKKIRINDMDGKPLEYVEQVAMFTLDDFRKLYEANNLFIKEYFGDYDLSKFNSECSKRLIITAQKND